MAIYKLSNATDGETCSCIKTDVTPVVVFPITNPSTNTNRHYREYKEWLAAGNTPDPSS